MDTGRRIKRILKAKLAAAVHAAASDTKWIDANAAAWSTTDGPGTPVDLKLHEALAVLELQPGATRVELKAAYKRLCKRYHPDRFAGDAHKAGIANELLTAINVAYAYLLKRVE